MKYTKKLYGCILLGATVFLVLFRLLAGEGFAYGETNSMMVAESAIVGELTAGTVLEQQFQAECNEVTEITLLGTTYGRQIDDVLAVRLLDMNGELLAEGLLETAGLPDCSLWTITFENPPAGCRAKLLTLQITSQNGVAGNAVSLFYGNSYLTGRYELPAQGLYSAVIAGQQLNGQLCLSVAGRNNYWFAQYYWQFAACVLMLTVGACLWIELCRKNGRDNYFLRLVRVASRYRFLLKQLVSRDFKTKYKRSVLGILWSFMNPLLTMVVMYVVFSTLFKSNIENFPVYLLIGIVCWNYFSEVTSSCLLSITGNAALITKVYVPKYIYPISRAMAASVNLGMSLIPLFIVMLLTGASFTARILLLPIPIVCLFLFSLGIGLFLASWMVLFRDTQFLWGVVNMLWMYLTPIFYDASIIPAQYMTLYKMNPLYHIVRMMRILLIEGVSPEPKAYLLCCIAAVVPLLLGLWIFKKTQDRFVLYL